MSSPPPDDLRLRLSEALFAIEPALNSWLKLGFRSWGITYARLRLLSALRFGGPRRLRDLGGELAVTARNVTGLVDALQRDGVVERLPHPTTAGPPWSGSPSRGTRLRRAAGRAAGRPGRLVG